LQDAGRGVGPCRSGANPADGHQPVGSERLLKNHVQNQKLEVRFDAMPPIFPTDLAGAAEPCACGPWV
jgi:hypothetical protein